ncbi:MAG: sugar-transfer associated ATP-grasp domain-containing protein [Syntrophorhabdaceae bacterium]
MNIFKLLKSMHQYASHYALFPRIFSDITPISRNGNKKVGKSKVAVFFDLFYLFVILKKTPGSYYLFRFHLKSRREFKNYMDGLANAPLLKHRLHKSLWKADYHCLVNDKYVFHKYCRFHGIPVPRVYGIYSNGSVMGSGGSLAQLMEDNRLQKVILKPVDGAAGKGIYFATYLNRRIEASPVKKTEDAALDGQGICTGDFIIQEIIEQHADLARMNPNCVNTIRLITFYTLDNKVEFLAAMLRTSSGKIPLDNFSLGGIVIKIDMSTGRLVAPGLMADGFIEEVASHPLTGTVFHDFQIPYWEKVKELAVRTQTVFYNLKAIGWDFAITPDGPAIIEGNIEWGTAGIQATNGGLLTPKNRKLFAQYGLNFNE